MSLRTSILRTSIPFCLAGLAWLVWQAWEQRGTGLSAEKSSAPGQEPESTTAGSLISRITATSSLGTATLESLATRLKSLPRDDAVSEIRGFLASGQDRKTTLAFTISSGNQITGWPTLRTFIIDLLLQIDPAAAANLSRGILSTPTNSDEWAICLRNLALGDPGENTSAYLQSKTVELIRNPDWQANPGIGYLQSFDVLVHTRASDQTPLLSEFVQLRDRPDLAHASFLTLDRLVQTEPAKTLRILASDQALLHARPEMSAQMFARADISNPQLREIVESYLLAPSRTDTELDAFTAIFPNANLVVSNNLLTTKTAPDGRTLADTDLKMLAVIESWISDPRFKNLTPMLQTIAHRMKNGMSQK